MLCGVSEGLGGCMSSITDVNIKCNGIPSFSAQWTWAKLGGLAIMASATKGFVAGSSSRPIPLSKLVRISMLSSVIAMPVPSPVSMHDLQHPCTISYIPFRRLPTSPDFRESIPGIRPGFFTMKAMSSAGSPPILKYSNPFSSTKPLKVECVASLTR